MVIVEEVGERVMVTGGRGEGSEGGRLMSVEREGRYLETKKGRYGDTNEKLR